MQKAIIDTTTRVIKRLTTDTTPSMLATESAIDMVTPIDLAGGFKKLDIDNVTLLVPTQQEIDASGVDDTRNAILKQQRITTYKNAINAILADATIPIKIRNYLQAIKDL